MKMKSPIHVYCFLLFLLLGKISHASFQQNEFERIYERLEDRMAEPMVSLQEGLDSCYSAAIDSESDYYLGRFYYIKGLIFDKKENDSSMYFFDESTSLLAEFQDSIVTLEVYFTKGNRNIFRDEFFKGIANLMKSVDLIDQNINEYLEKDEQRLYYLQSQVMTTFGIVYARFNDYELSLSYFLKALKVSKNFQSIKGNRFQTVILSNLAMAYAELGEYDQAEYYSTSSIDLKRSLGLTEQEGFNYRILGWIAYQKGQYDLGLKYLEIAEERHETNEVEKAKDLFYRAKCLVGKGDYKEANDLLIEVEPLFSEKLTRNDQADLYEELATCNRLSGELEKSVTWYEKSLSIREEIEQKANHQVFGEFLEFFNQREAQFNEKLKAFEVEQERIKLSDQIYAEKQRKKWIYASFAVITILLIAVIFMVTSAYRRNKKVTKSLEDTVEQKEVLFQEVHHRVKNNFQIISSLLNLQSYNQEDERNRKVLEEAKTRIQSMSLVHELLYKTGDLSHICFYDYSVELATSIFKAFDKTEKIELKIYDSNKKFGLEIAIPIGLILNEAITNAVKYAFRNKEDGKIEIELIEIKEELLLSIRDNGIGFSTERMSQTGLGMELMEILTEQIDGRFDVDSGDHGTEILIYLPLDKV